MVDKMLNHKGLCPLPVSRCVQEHGLFFKLCHIGFRKVSANVCKCK